MDKVPVIIIAIIVVVGAVFGGIYWYVASNQPVDTKVTPLPSGIVFFYGQECPHCANIEKYIADNKIQDKVKYTMLEVWHNQENANLMVQIAKQCGVATADIGVPFFYDGVSKCYIGETDVTTFLNQQAGIK